MKKIINQGVLIGLILILALIFTSCTGSDNQIKSEDEIKKEAFLEDFDYMMQTMEDTFPYFGVAKRKWDVDIRELGRETREVIANYPQSLEATANEMEIPLEDMPDLDEQIFWSILRNEFFAKISGLAHAYPLDYKLYEAFKNPYSHQRSPLYTNHNHESFSNEFSEAFYVEQEIFFNNPDEQNQSRHKLVFRDKPLPQLTDMKVSTDILKEDKVAYLSVPSFMNFTPSTITNLKKFYEDTQSYEHLIIDIRDNSGGSPDVWRMLIMNPLWPDRKNMPDMPFYAFYKGSDLSKTLGEENIEIEGKNSRNIPQSNGLLKAEEIIRENNLKYINEDDKKDLAYGVRYNTSISNIDEKAMQHLGFRSYYPFEGKIWLLTNENNYSGAALFARHAKDMGFATLVGEATGGAYTTSSGLFFSLPNTGIILRWDVDYLTDSEGRALNEYTTTPHYNSNDNMDALETVLKIIEAGTF